MTAKNKPEAIDPSFFVDNEMAQEMHNMPAQSSFVLDFTQSRDTELIPDGSTVNMSIASAKASNYNDVLQFSVRLNVVDGDYEGRGLFENIQLARVIRNGDKVYLEPWYDSTGKSATWKMARLLDGIQFEGDRQIVGTTEQELIDSLNTLGQAIKGEVCTVTVNVWGDGTRIDPQTGEPYPKRNGIKAIKPFETKNTASNLFNS